MRGGALPRTFPSSLAAASMSPRTTAASRRVGGANVQQHKVHTDTRGDEVAQQLAARSAVERGVRMLIAIARVNNPFPRSRRIPLREAQIFLTILDMFSLVSQGFRIIAMPITTVGPRTVVSSHDFEIDY